MWWIKSQEIPSEEGNSFLKKALLCYTVISNGSVEWLVIIVIWYGYIVSFGYKSLLKRSHGFDALHQ